MLLEKVLFAFFLFMLFSLTKNRKYRKLREQIGCYGHIPFIGSALIVFDLKDLLYKWPKIVKNVQLKSAFIFLGPFLPVFYTYNREYVQKLLLSPDCNGKAFVYSLIRQEIGPGLAALKGTIWKQHRKLLNPLLSHGALMNSFPVVNKFSSSFIKELEQFVGMGEIEILSILTSYTIKTSVAFEMDLELQDDNEEHVLFIKHLVNFMTILVDRMSNLLISFDTIFRWTKACHPYYESKKFVFDFIRKIVRKRISAINSNNTEQKCTDNGFLQKIVDIHLNGDFSLEDVVSEIFTVLFGSFGTSTTTLEVLILSLAMYPECQAKLFEEVQRIFPDNEFDVKHEDLKQLIYMEQFLNETFRLYSIVPMLGRETSKDIQISDDIVIPAGTNIVIDLFKMHRDKDNWGPNAKHFDPDNFSEELVARMPPYAFVPFSRGPRDCIGSRYSKIFLKASLAKIVRNFRFETRTRLEDLHFLFEVLMKLKTSPLIEVYKR